MTHIVDVGLENLSSAPAEVLDSAYWETDRDDVPDARFTKEEWFSSTLLEWGPCGKLVLEGDLAVGFAQFAPPSLFPRLATFRAGRVSPDAAYLAYCFVSEGHRGRGVGSQVVRAVARELVERGFRAVESLARPRWDEGWVLPQGFLVANRFTVIRPDPDVPLMRLDLLGATPSRSEAAAAASA